MFEVIVKLKNDWIDLQGVPETDLFKGLSDWSSGKSEKVKFKNFEFESDQIVDIRISR